MAYMGQIKVRCIDGVVYASSDYADAQAQMQCLRACADSFAGRLYAKYKNPRAGSIIFLLQIYTHQYLNKSIVNQLFADMK